MDGELLQRIEKLREENTELRKRVELIGKAAADAFPESNTLHYLKTVLGYNIKRDGNTIILRSVYAFCNEDTFEIEAAGNKLILKDTDHLGEWKELFDTYVKRGGSYCAFFAAVTLELYSRKTFG